MTYNRKIPPKEALNLAGEIRSVLKHRTEGVLINHSCSKNSVKMYDKQGHILRVETTIHNATRFRRPIGQQATARRGGNHRARVLPTYTAVANCRNRQ
jgi:hypothetical protein